MLPTASPTGNARPCGAKPSRLASVKKGVLHEPHRYFLYGPEGVGKSSLALDIADSITLDVEQSAQHMPTDKFPTPQSLAEVYEAIDTLRTGQHKYRTLIVDTVDRLEAMVWQAVCANASRKKSGDKPESIEDFGYGKGYQYAHDAPEARVNQEHLPAALRGREYYRPTDRGLEAEIGRRLADWRRWRAATRASSAESSRIRATRP